MVHPVPVLKEAQTPSIRVSAHMPATASHLPHPDPDSHDAGCLDSQARAIPRDQKGVASLFRGFVIVESDEPLIAALSPNHQIVLHLTGSYAEMREQLKVPPGTLRSRLHRARAALVALRQKQSGPDGPI